MTLPLAKLTPPSLSRIYPRARLFGEIDNLGTCPVLWISAPAGAGKTTLVADYLAKRGIAPLWFHVDPGDGDIASFFYYLGEGLKRLTGARKRILPLLTPEYQLGVPAFSRHFFRKLFATLQPPAVLVLDNIEVLHEAEAINEALRHGLEEAPPGARVIVTGRCLPPPPFARMMANGRMAQLGWDRLQLTPAESREVITFLSGGQALSEEAIRGLQNAARGWMAGLVLLLNCRRRNGPLDAGSPLPAAVTESLSRQHFDDYFAAELFHRLAPETLAFLLKTAWLNPVRAETARSLSGNEEAETILDNLERNQMFVTGNGGPRPVYRYHPLLRGFLQTEAERTLTPETLHVIKGETAAILAREGDLAAAARLYAETRHWPALAHLIVENAPTLWEQGRVEPLRQWLDRLPPGRVEREPWLAYWHGNASLLFEPRQAGRHFETAFHAFDERGDATGVCLSLTGILDSIMYGNDSLGDVPRWLDVMERVRQRREPCPAPEAVLRLEFTAFNMGFLACPGQTDAGGWRARARRLERMVSAIPDDTLRCMSASHLAMYYTWHPQPARLRLLADDLYKYAVSEETPPLARLIAYLVEITRRWVTAETDGTDTVIAEALQMMETRGVHVGRLWLLSAAIFYHLTRGAVQAAETLLQRFHTHVRPGFRNEQAHYHLLAAWLAILRQDAELAHQHAETAYGLVRVLHTPHFELLSRAVHCLTLARLARFDAALRAIADTRALAAAIHARHVGVFHLGLLEAWIARHQGRREDALRRLRPALACGREMALRVSPGMDRQLLAEMCALALENGIETAYVRRLIHWNALLPPPGVRLPPAWPLAVHIRALGELELRVQGRRVPLLPAHNKPLKLLRVLLALGGRDVADSRVEDILWPDAEGPAAHRALITNLQRLRRLLGGNHVVRHRNGRLGLDPRHCWVDIWALEQGLEDDGPESLIRLLKLYRDDFLRDEEDAWWLLERRERLRAEILRHYGRLQAYLEKTHRWRDLIEWCLRGLRIDELHEPFYQSLMRAHRQLGRYGEAARVYHQCRRKLRDRLGTTPGPETRALFESLPSR